MTSRNSSTSSSASSSRAPQPSSSSGAPRRVANVCYPKGKWYDCLRPTTTPYQGFGSLTNFANATERENQMDVGAAWTNDVHAKMMK
ncbi:hypothetical protein PV08_05050 [Exophiala spinifera]|uniref:Uncharacterized protein n=1 Tax=Exophiala spinifera TaxID=91928 RepID=A0A0D2BGV7_9EURO|nr:uncharacterized protein PV08_05050 [Exophiala spinifera]KIW17855.1 hypothetical protein PV08_05050 [Exophiala spinifera]